MLAAAVTMVLFHNHHFATHYVCAAFEGVFHFTGAYLLGYKFARQREHINRCIVGAVDCGIVYTSGNRIVIVGRVI